MSMARMTITIPPEVADKTRERHGTFTTVSAQIANDLACYYQLIESGMKIVGETFGEEEMGFFLEATQGFTWGPRMVPALIRRALITFIEDYMKDRDKPGYAETIDKYNKLSEIGRLALVDLLTIKRSQQ